MMAASAVESNDAESIRCKRQRVCPPSPAANIPNPFDNTTASANTKDPQSSLSAVEEYDMHPQEQSQFFQLPGEIREMIYQLACVNNGLSALLRKKSCRQASQESAKEPAFLRSCRLARIEGSAVFYQNNDFVVRRRDSINFHPRPLLESPIPFPFNSSGTGVPRWLDNMSSEKVARIQSVVLVQLTRGVYKDTYNEWHRDASACFRLRHSKRREKGYEIEYIRVDASGRSDKYAERLLEALEMRMDKLVESVDTRQWTRQSIWDMAYLL